MSSERPELARGVYFVLAIVVLVLDQVTKVIAHSQLPGRASIEIIPGLFDLSYTRNRGGLFGYFSQLADPWRSILLTVLPLLAVGMIAWFLARGRGADRRTLFGLGLILGGAVGNLIDRIFRGEVIDFLDVYASSERLANWLIETFGTAHWPTFNLADSAIVVGACLLLLTILMPQPDPDAANAGAPTAAGG